MRPIAMEEEVAKPVAVMIIAQTEKYVNDRQWSYQRGRSAGDVARMLTMLRDDTREEGNSVVLYKRDRSNVWHIGSCRCRACPIGSRGRIFHRPLPPINVVVHSRSPLT